MFLGVGSEEAGVEATERDWLAGSQAFVNAHPEVMRRLAYDFNIDLSGWTSKKGSLNTTPDLVPAQRQLLADLGLSSWITADAGVPFTNDAWNFGVVGGGAVSIMRWTGEFGDEPNPYAQYYHTQIERYRPEDYANLPVHLRVGALSVLRMDQAVTLPVQFAEVASWAERALEADAGKVADVSFDEARSALREFRAQAERVEAARAKITSSVQATPLNRWLMKTRKDFMPWLYAQGPSSFRTSSYASTLAALGAARAAAEKGDRDATLGALDRTGAARTTRFSPEVVRDERLYWYTSGDWSAAYEQKTRPVGADLDALYRRLKNSGDIAAEVPRLRQLEAQARGYLTEALFLVSGKLRGAANALRESPLP